MTCTHGKGWTKFACKLRTSETSLSDRAARGVSVLDGGPGLIDPTRRQACSIGLSGRIEANGY